MEIIKKGQEQIFKNGNIIAHEYSSINQNINIGLVEIKGRHPQQDFLVNEKVTELVYLIKGTAILNTETNSFNLSEGDFAIISPNEKYFWEGDCTVITPCTPAWTLEQNKIVK